MNYLEKITLEYENENKTEISCLVIKKGQINHISYGDLDYVKQLINLNLCETCKFTSETFVENLYKKLEINNNTVSKNNNLFAKNDVVAEEPYYSYELIYIDYDKGSEYIKDENINEFATLINNGQKVYSNALLFKNHLPSLSKSMYLTDMTTNDLERILTDRVNTKVVVYDSNWREEIVIGDLNYFAEQFFDGEKYYKLEIPFLLHNINIWYNTCKYSGSYDLCGKLIDGQVENCIWFTMKTEEYRGNLTLDEVKKIIHLSKVLDKYKTPDRFYKEEYDDLGRRIIYTKYKVLDYMYKYPLAED